MGTRSRTLKYLPGHELRFAIAPVSRNSATGNVDEAVCLFCKYFGREQRVGKKRKCASTVKYFRDSFRPDQYTQHHQLQHPTQWQLYKDLSDDEKLAFFPLTDKMTTASTDRGGTNNVIAEVLVPELHERGRCFDIKAAIVEIVAVIAVGMGPVEPTVQTRDRLMYEYMTHHHYEREPPSNCPRWDPPPNTFEKCYVVRNEPPMYRVVLYTKAQLDFVMELAAQGLSGTQIAASVKVLRRHHSVVCNDLSKPISKSSEKHATATEWQTSRVTNNMHPEFGEVQTSEIVRLGVAVSLNIISTFLEESWAFSLEFCTVVHAQSFSYLDLRVRFYNQIGGLRSAHLLAIPNSNNTCDLMMRNTLDRVLTVVLSDWKSKLLGISTTGSLPFSAHINKVVAHFQNVATRSVLYRTSNCVCQVQHIMRCFFSSIDDGQFFKTLKSMSAYVRQEPCVLSEIKTLPGFWDQLNIDAYGDSSPSVAIGREVDMLVAHASFLQLHLEAVSCSKSQLKVSVAWWAGLQVVQWITARTNAVFNVLEEHHVTIFQQATVITRLAEEFITNLQAQIFETKGLVSKRSSTDYISLDKRVSLSKTHLENFVTGSSEFARHGDTAIAQVTAERFANGAVNMIASLVELSVSLKQQCAACTTNRYDQSNVVTHVLPPVMPQDLACLSSDEFDEMLELHANMACADTDVNTIRKEHELLQHTFANNTNLKTMQGLCTKNTPFHVAWSLMDGRFKFLEALAGGLATVFSSHVVPIADKYNSDLVLCPKELDEARLMLADFELESALHGKQFPALAQLQEEMLERDIDQRVRKHQKTTISS